MNWLALTPFEVTALFCGAAALAVWLYLQTHRPQRRRVSTLRFWANVQPSAQKLRLHLREPWALLAQLLFLLLVILALGNPRWGNAPESRRVVIVLDNSVWSQVHPPAGSPWMDQVRAEAQKIVDACPSGDQVLLLSAEPDAPPILPFTTDRAELHQAITEIPASNAIADLPRALERGQAALAGARLGLLVYIGPGMLDEQQARGFDQFRKTFPAAQSSGEQHQFLTRIVGDAAHIDNRGITRLSVRRDADEPDRWHVLAQVKNYGDAAADATLKLSVNGQPLGQRAIALAPNEMVDVENTFVWQKGGALHAEIGPRDELDADNLATVNLPAFRPVRVALFTTDAAFAKDLINALSSDPYLEPELALPGTAPENPPDVAIYQGTAPPMPPAYNSIWFLGGALAGAHPLRIAKWNTQHPVTRWVRTHDITVRNSVPFPVLPGDTVLASAEGNPPVPLIVARQQNGRRIVVIGFGPHESNFPLESAFPLLMAGSIEWMTRPVEEMANLFAAGEVDLPGPVARIIAPSGKDVPFARNSAAVHFVATETGIYRVMAPGSETTIAVNITELPAQRFTANAEEAAPVASETLEDSGWDLWRLLAALAIIPLWLEWRLYYTKSKKRQRAGVRAGFDLGLYPARSRDESETSDPREITKIAS